MFENVHLLHQMESIFAKDYQKNSYNKIIFIEKNIDDKNILATFRKHSYF
jgi:hypothetical protein